MEPVQAKKRVLFLSMHNAARSQMAEALLRDFAEEKFDAFSAGVEPMEVNRTAVAAMQEVGIDIAHNRSTPLEFYANQSFDYVIVLCDPSSEVCPSFANAKQQFTWNFKDLGRATGNDDQKLQIFRDFRDALSQKIHEEIVRT